MAKIVVLERIRERYDYATCPRCRKRKLCYRIYSEMSGYEERIFDCGGNVVVEVKNPLTGGLIYEAESWVEAVRQARTHAIAFD
ncbi:MAG: hypothetical protein QXZ31_03590 [Thermofilaceae archaeon]